MEIQIIDKVGVSVQNGFILKNLDEKNMEFAIISEMKYRRKLKVKSACTFQYYLLKVGNIKLSDTEESRMKSQIGILKHFLKNLPPFNAK